MFAVVIQIGAIAAVVVYFWGRLVKFAKTFPQGERKNKTFMTHPLTLVFVAFVVTAGPAYLLKKRIDKNLESRAGDGAVAADRRDHHVGGGCDNDQAEDQERRGDGADRGDLDWLLPDFFGGVSRHVAARMSTIAGGQMFGMSRRRRLEFSFFVSIPIMFAATAKELKDCLRPAVDAVTGIRPEGIHLSGSQWGVVFVGTAVSFVVAWGVIAWFMQWVRRHGFVPFAIYRIVIGAAVIAAVSAGKLSGT